MPRYLKDGDIYASLALIALGVMILVQSLPWDFQSPDGPGPAMFPRLYGSAMIALSVILLASKLRSNASAAASETPLDWTGIARALFSFTVFAAAVASMGYAGFSIPFGLFTFFLVLFVFRRSFVTALVTGIAMPAAFYAMFPTLLGVELPTGIVGF